MCLDARGNWVGEPDSEILVGFPTDMYLVVTSRRKWVEEPDSEIPAGGVLLHLYLGALLLAPGHQIGHGDGPGDYVD